MYADVNGTTIYYETAGHGPRTILLCHGNGSSHAVFDVLAEAMAPDFTVYLPDTRGHGQSAPVAEYHYTDMAEDMAALITALSLKNPAFYGFSDGGIVGLLLASRHPGLLSRLAVSGANFTVDGVVPEVLADWRRENRENPNPLLKLLLTEPSMTAAHLARIKTPTLVMAGEFDVIRPEHTRSLAAAIPNAELRFVPGENHGSYIEHSAKVYQIMRDFLLA